MSRNTTEAIPAYSDGVSCHEAKEQCHVEPENELRDSTIAPNATETHHRHRASSLSQAFLESHLPYGMWQATGDIAAHAPSISDVRSGSFSHTGWTAEGQREKRTRSSFDAEQASRSRRTSATYHRHSLHSPIIETPINDAADIAQGEDRGLTKAAVGRAGCDGTHDLQSGAPEADVHVSEAIGIHELLGKDVGPDETGTYPNGYRFPPKHTWRESIVIGLKAFCKFSLTPFGFLITLYGLNVIAWGAMIFFLLLNAAPAMCKPSCNADNSPRRIWIEIDAQVLNALFCVTGLGFIPWRFRDLFWLIRWRVFGSTRALRTLAGIQNSWYRLPESDKLDVLIGPLPTSPSERGTYPETRPTSTTTTNKKVAELEAMEALPLPSKSIPQAPLTGVRAPPTSPWKLDFVVWMYVINTGFQILLCFSMWHWNRFDRPVWIQAFAICMACIVAAAAGIMAYVEGKHVKKVEGVPVFEEKVDDAEKQARR